MTDFIAASDKLVAAYNSKDFAALRRLISPDLDMAHFNRNFAVKRLDDLMPVMEAFGATLMPDRRFLPPERVTAHGNIVVREAYWTGTAKGDIPGFGANGEQIRLKLCSVLRFDDKGILVEWKDYG